VETLQQRLPDGIGEEAKHTERSTTASKAAEKNVPASLPRRSAQGAKRRFVIQKHAATHLHCDLRLELGGALKSWAVPRGVPYQPGVRRLANGTEDHPIEYLDFEGVIPEGQYGGGTVMVWDIGTWEIIEGNYWKGNLDFALSGEKLNGQWKLLRDRAKGQNAWT